MDFETSCWTTGTLSNGAPTVYTYDNPVQRHQKIDFFDTTSITPIVSHISSNGYYGYCPTTNLPSLDEMCTANGQKDATNIDFAMTEMIVPMESTNSEQSKHQGRSIFENRKRAVQSTADDFVEQGAKRRRNHLSVIDYVEGLYTHANSLHKYHPNFVYLWEFFFKF